MTAIGIAPAVSVAAAHSGTTSQGRDSRQQPEIKRRQTYPQKSQSKAFNDQ
jgi:hypothetical protein